MGYFKNPWTRISKLSMDPMDIHFVDNCRLYTDAGFASEHLPQSFRRADVIALRSPANRPKHGRTLELTGLFHSMVGKVVETAVCRRMAQAAETHQVLPDGQMGANRLGRDHRRHGAAGQRLHYYLPITSPQRYGKPHLHPPAPLRNKRFLTWMVRCVQLGDSWCRLPQAPTLQ